MADSSELRLNKAIAAYGYCSRRLADSLIQKGFVSVNGEKTLNPADRISPADQIRIKGKLINKQVKPIYLLLNKPVQIICTLKDPQGRRTIIDILPEKYKGARLFPVGRLDYFSEGLLLLTNDGELANTLMHPGKGHEKTYKVLIRGRIDDHKLELMRKGLLLEGKFRLRPIKVSSESLPDGNTLLIMTLKQGLNRQIRRICDQFGWTILKLKRVSEAGIKLGQLKSGACRELTPEEVAALKREN